MLKEYNTEILDRYVVTFRFFIMVTMLQLCVAFRAGGLTLFMLICDSHCRENIG